ncbi:MAG TPA: hypothetical protein VFE57_13670 [Cyclobacteriaceae bacterium]|jgi:hypothetical protein|nr:hypothetical protein [Cyclobacteriaceae bacterium]
MLSQGLTSENRKLLLDDYFNWDSQLAKAKSDELTSLEIAQVKESFAFLRKQLGEDFPQQCLDNNSPINHYFGNRAPWTRIWFNWLAEAILELSFSADTASLVKKLKSPDGADFHEAKSILEVGLKLVKAGFAIQIEGNIINDKGQQKKPDLIITNPETKELGLVEITRLTKNPTSIKYESILQNVYFNGLEHGSNLQFAGRLFKEVSNEHLQEITAEIDSKLTRYLKSKTFQVVRREGVIEFAFARSDDPVMKEWAESNKYNLNTFSFPETDVLSRVRTKIIHKKDQLSSEHPSILVIRNEESWITAGNYESIQEGLLETMHRYPQLLALVLIGVEMGSVSKTISGKGLNFYVERTERYLHTSKTIMLFNRFCKTKITPHTMMRILDAFEKH